jgi:hypothetical protein
MNIDVSFSAQISKVSVSVTAKDGVIKRTCKLVLAREFDDLLAAGLKGDARVALKSLRAGGLSEAVLPIDGIVASGTLVAMGGECHIPDLHGLTAKARAAKEEGEPPSIKLEFAFDFAEKSWLFLGRNCSAQAEITIRSLQTEMEFPVGAKGNGRGKRPRAEV